MTVRYKDFAIKADGGAEGNGGFTGHAATFDREPDSYDDVIAKGAFAFDYQTEYHCSKTPRPFGPLSARAGVVLAPCGVAA